MAGSQDFAEDPRNRSLLVLVNGALVPAAEASVSVFDAGFGLGDGVWEGLRLHKGALLFLDAHLDRLEAGARAIGIAIGRPRSALVADLKRLIDANGMTDGAHVRLMVTRGRKRSINQDPRHTIGPPTIVVTAEYKAKPPDAKPLTLHLSRIRTSGREIFDMRLNSHSRLNYIRALLEAIDAGADEAVMLDPEGHVASCNATNLFWVKDGTLFTATDAFCFPGITRGHVIEAARAGAAPIALGGFPPSALLAADEAFVTGTLGGLTPVGSIDGKRLAAAPGPVTERLTRAYDALKDADAATHPLG